MTSGEPIEVNDREDIDEEEAVEVVTGNLAPLGDDLEVVVVLNGVERKKDVDGEEQIDDVVGHLPKV